MWRSPQIYNEVINDLLAPANTNLRLREHQVYGVYIEGVKEEVVVSIEHIMSLIAAGEAHRHVGSTNFNAESSRSHTIFQMNVESSLHTDSDRANDVRSSVLNLIDLAGSESSKVQYETAVAGARRREGSYINKSLLTLGSVITKVSVSAPMDDCAVMWCKANTVYSARAGGVSTVGCS